jgi:hypothetical protein
MTTRRIKSGALSDIASRALFGAKNLSAAELENIGKYVTRSGHVRANSQRGLLKSTLLGNENAMNILKSRYRQGGLIGKGGIVLGEIAPSDDFINSAKKLKRYLGSAPGTAHDMTRSDISNLAFGGLGTGLGVGFTLGYPLLDAYDIARGRNPEYGEGKRGSGVVGALGSGAGFLLSSGFGLPAGILASSVGKHIGERVGRVFDPAEAASDYAISPTEAALPGITRPLY